MTPSEPVAQPPEPSEGVSFTKDWFSHNIPSWTKYILPLAGRKMTYLEVGTYEGLSLKWMLENVLTHTESKARCHDLWRVTEIWQRFHRNLDLFPGKEKVTPVIGKSEHTLRSLVEYSVDIAYIDGDHEARAALSDAVMVWPLLKSGGILIFDDYQWKQAQQVMALPREGINAFLNLWEGQYTLLHKGYQVILQKR